LVQLKKIENLMRNLTTLLSDILHKCWLCRYTFIANAPLVAIGDKVAHPGDRAYPYKMFREENLLPSLAVRFQSAFYF
jgi:hypothetical protein